MYTCSLSQLLFLMDESEYVSFSPGLTCQHVSQAVDVHHVKRAVAQSVWSICAECLKERRMSDGEPVAPSDIWLCLKCGSQVSIRWKSTGVNRP